MASITKSTGITTTGRQGTTVEEVELVDRNAPDIEAPRGVRGNVHDVMTRSQCEKSVVGQVAAVHQNSREASRYGGGTVQRNV